MQNAEIKKVDDLKQRTKNFALRIISLYSSLPKRTEAQVIGKQFLRSENLLLQTTCTVRKDTIS